MPLNISIKNIRVILCNIKICPYPCCLPRTVPSNLLAVYLYFIFNRFSLNIIFPTSLVPQEDKCGVVNLIRISPGLTSEFSLLSPWTSSFYVPKEGTRWTRYLWKRTAKLLHSRWLLWVEVWHSTVYTLTALEPARKWTWLLLSLKQRFRLFTRRI